MSHTDGPIDLAAVLPRLLRLSTVLGRSRLAERAMDRLGIALDRPAVTVLVTLRVAGRPLRVGEIAERMEVVGPHVTRLLHDLERRGLVRRTADPADQRARLVELAPEGDAAAGRYLQAVLDWFADALTGWSDHDRQEFGRLLGRFADDLTARLAALDERPG
jgi:DNA-binding MarR family transcriptional regulator